MTGHRIAFVLAACVFVLAVAACGGDATSTRSPTPRSSTALSFLDIPGASVSVTPTPTPAPTRSGQAIVQADLSSVASLQTTIETLERVIQDRLGDAGVHSNISQTSDAELTIDFTGNRSIDFVRQVIEATSLNFRQPIITASGEIMCKMSDGNEFSVQAANVQQTAEETGTRFANCTASNGQTGEVEWQPAQADVNGATKTLTQAMIDASQAEITSTPQQGTVLLLTFTPEGTSLFTALTGRLVNYPLGFFLGDTLLTAPTVQQEIANGETVILGQTDDELAAARAVLKGGELPVSVTVTRIAPGSPAP